jgi:X-X-X-Leu-X-X-Gly heptad repeat protein
MQQGAKRLATGAKRLATGAKRLATRAKRPLLNLWHIRHLTVLVRVFTTDFTVPNFIGQHRIVAGAGTPKFIARYQVPNIDQQKGNTEYGEDDGKEGKKTVHNGSL